MALITAHVSAEEGRPSRAAQDSPPAVVSAGQFGAAADVATPAAQWSKDADPLSIHITSSRSVPTDAFGDATRSSLQRLSANGSLASFCETPARYPLQIRFYVDAMGLPRPGPFIPPAVSTGLTFTLDGNSTPTVERKEADPKPTYLGSGHALQTCFGDVVSMTAGGNGTLGVVAKLADPGTHTTVRYTDDIPCRLEPCA
jgi:hypothetical protein